MKILEFQFRTEYQFDILRSRNRSRADVTKGIRCTLNPDSTHFVYEWVKPFLDEEGFPIKELSGKTRYYLIVDGTLHTDWCKQTLVEKFEKNPQTYTYIPATLDDNDYLNKFDSEYRDNLDSMPEKKRKQLLLGCWAPDEDSGMYFQRKWLHRATHVPVNSKYCRGWDTASEVPNENNKNPDWTVGVQMAKSPDGYYYICGMERFQDRPGGRDQRIITVGHRDGVDCTVVAPIDPAAAGKFQWQEFSKKMVEAGLMCKPDPTPNNKSKLKKFEPFSIACENGLVYIVESSFSPEDLETFYRELEMFNGERSTTRRHDDICDSTASAFSFLASNKVVPTVAVPTFTQKNPFDIWEH